MPYDDRLKDYVDVKERIRLFLERHPDGRLVTAKVKVTDQPDGVPRVWVKAKAYRSPDDTHPGVGWSWMQLPGSTNFTRGSEIENTETSAWGRAIGAVGIGIAHSIASADEVRAKDGQDAPRGPETARDAAEGLIGTVITQGNQDLELRALPSGGFATRFRLKDGRSSFICQATSPLADALVAVRDELIDHRVTLFGKWSDESFRKGKETVRFKLLNVTRVETPEWVLPAPGLTVAEALELKTEPEEPSAFDALEFPDRLPLEEPA